MPALHASPVMRSPASAAVAVLVIVVVIAASAEGLRCFVCNSKADSRCADPIQAAEDSAEEEDGNNNNINSNSNSNNNKNNNKNSNSHSSNNNNNQNNRNDESDEGLRMVDCKVAHSVRQAMDAVSGLLSRLGQRSPGGGDVWAAVRHAGRGSSQQGQGQGGLLGDGQGRGQAGGQGSLRGYDEQEPSAACHKVDMTVDGELVTDRGCAPGRVLGQEPCEALAIALGDPDFCELCDGDGCNASALVRASVTVVVVALAAMHALGHVLEHGGVHLPQHQWSAC